MSSASSCSPSGVEPEMSAKRTVTRRRFSLRSIEGSFETWSDAPTTVQADWFGLGLGGGWVEPTGVPQFGQKRCVGRRTPPHPEQRRRVDEEVVLLRGADTGS